MDEASQASVKRPRVNVAKLFAKIGRGQPLLIPHDRGYLSQMRFRDFRAICMEFTNHDKKSLL
jgi:hypothetical protein